jgi:cytochrome d ubiquinol oxidase subunit II
LVSLIAIRRLLARPDSYKAFVASCFYIIGMLASAACALYPYVLPSNADPRHGLTIWNSAAGNYGLRVALAWFMPGMVLVMGYFLFVYRHFAGKVRAEEEGY